MSDTPRTDAGLNTHYDEMCDYEFDWVDPEVSRQLEREGTAMAAQLVKMVEEASELRLKLKQAESRADMAQACVRSFQLDEGADAARLEWLINHAGGVVINLDDNFMDREGIDKAMKQEENK